MDSVSAVTTSFDSVAAGARQTGNAVSALFDQQAGIQNDLATLGKDAANAAATLVQSKGAVEIATQNAIRKNAQLFGADATETRTYLIGPLAEQERDLSVVADAAYDDYTRKNETDFFSNPMAWIANNVFGGTEQARMKFNDVAKKVNDIHSRITGIYEHTKEGALNEKALEQTVTAEQIAAEATVKGFQFLQMAGKAKYDALGSNVEALKAIQEGRVQEVNAKAKKLEIQRQSEEFKMSQQRLALAMEEHKEKVETRQFTANVLRLGMAQWNLAPPSDANIDNMSKLMQTPEGRAELGPIVSAGMHAMATLKKDGSFDHVLGRTAGDAVLGIMALNPKFPEKSGMANAVDNMMEHVVKELPAHTLKEKSKPEFIKEVNEKAKEVSESYLVNAENPRGVYYDKGFAAQASNKELVESDFWKQVITPFTAHGQDKASAAEILAAGTKLAVEGKISPQKLAISMREYYETVAALNNQSAPVVGFKAQDTYNAKTGSSWNAGTINFMDSWQILNHITKAYNEQQKQIQTSNANAQGLAREAGREYSPVPAGTPNPFLRNP